MTKKLIFLILIVSLQAHFSFANDKSLAKSSRKFAVIALDPNIYKVFDDGTVTKIKHIEFGGYGTGTQAQYSPSGNFVVYLSESNLWKVPLNGGKKTKISTQGDPGNNQFYSIDVNITDISRDGKKVLYQVYYLDGHGDGPRRAQQKADYGFFLYDFEKKTTIKTSIPYQKRIFGSQGWILDDHIVFLDTEKKLQSYPLKGGESQLIYHFPKPEYTFVNQVVLDSDEKNMYFAGIKHNSISQILKMNFETKKIEEVSPFGTFVEYQRPSVSPDGKTIAYSHRPNVQDSEELYINNEKMFSFPYAIEGIYWIDNRYAAVTMRAITRKTSTHIVVIDIKNKKIIKDNDLKSHF